MIDISTETLLLPGEAAKEVPGRPHTSTIIRWMLKGVAGGQTLDSVKIGGRRYTSREALQLFAERLSQPRGDQLTRSSVQRDHAVTNAADKLAAMGV